METYLSIEGLAKYLGVAEKSVRKWVLNRDIPFHKIMKLIRFRLSEIEQWVETNGKFPKAKEDELSEGELLEDEKTKTREDELVSGVSETGGAA